MTDVTKLKIDLWKRLAESPIVMAGPASGRFHHEPLAVQLDRDSVDTLWFFVRKDNRLTQDGWATVEFVSKGHDYFAGFSGVVRAVDDPAMVDKLWSKQAEVYFPSGKTDPELALVRFDIEDAELWEIELGITGKLRMLFGGKFNPAVDGSHAVVDSTAL